MINICLTGHAILMLTQLPVQHENYWTAMSPLIDIHLISVEHESLNSSVTQVVIHYTTIHTSQVEVITKQARVITCK